jgi:hypothetical protein
VLSWTCCDTQALLQGSLACLAPAHFFSYSSMSMRCLLLRWRLASMSAMGLTRKDSPCMLLMHSSAKQGCLCFVAFRCRARKQ